jgi:hypothetical protein
MLQWLVIVMLNAVKHLCAESARRFAALTMTMRQLRKSSELYPIVACRPRRGDEPGLIGG